MTKPLNTPESLETKKCPFCSEEIRGTALKCRYCGEWLTQDNEVPPIASSIKSVPKRSIPKILLFIGLIIIFLIILIQYVIPNFKTGNSSIIPSSNQPTEESLRSVVNEQYRLLKSKNDNDLRRLYREFYSPEHKAKQQSEDQFVNDILKTYSELSVDHQEYELHSVRIEGQRGFADRTRKYCYDASCSKSESDRSIRLYIYFNNKWLMSDEEILCSRTTPFTSAPEFDRAYSLIIQRTANYKTDYPELKNCLNIQYANSDTDMDGAEGLFLFTPGQSAEELDIFVSPRYRIKDDLITAILLVHEVQHASDYLGELKGYSKSDCFTKEARAFQNQNWFISLLNQEEMQSINARLATGASDELRSIKQAWDGVNRMPGATTEERALKYVKSIPAYIDQCSK